MQAWSILLRAILVVSLALNGSGYALASAQMRMAPAPASPTALTIEIAPASALPCHEQMSDETAAAVPLVDALQDAPQPSSKSIDDECCPAGACGCDCTHAQAALLAYAHVVVGVEHVPAACTLQMGHTAPALPHSMRPPIV